MGQKVGESDLGNKMKKESKLDRDLKRFREAIDPDATITILSSTQAQITMKRFIVHYELQQAGNTTYSVEKLNNRPMPIKRMFSIAAVMLYLQTVIV